VIPINGKEAMTNINIYTEKGKAREGEGTEKGGRKDDRLFQGRAEAWPRTASLARVKTMKEERGILQEGRRGVYRPG